jgi:hypothetical protein
MSVLLITGTDRGVGKTWVGRALGRTLAAAGRRVVAIKPVETGTDDGALLAAATGQAEPLAALHRLEAAVDPALAADRAGACDGVARGRKRVCGGGHGAGQALHHHGDADALVPAGGQQRAFQRALRIGGRMAVGV